MNAAKILLPLLLLLLCHATAGAAQIRTFFAPSATDPAITQPSNNHYAVVDPAQQQKGRLVVFFPGTGGTPIFYSDFIENAASLGFHGLGLMYPNTESVNEYCTQYDPANPDSARDARLEVIDGTDRVSFLAVDRPNSIENRLLKALQYLHATYPTRGWGQYFSGNTVRWDKLIVCGHSQGGGHAAMLAKTRQVDRCLLFAWVDWWVYGRQFYPWLGDGSLTSVSQWYQLGHERDQKVNFALFKGAADTLDVDRYGDNVRAEDAASPDFLGSHVLSTNLEPARGTNGEYHGTMVVDPDIPRLPDGVTPVLKPAWDYLLLHETPPVALTLTGQELQITFSPGTLEFSENLRSWQPVANADSPVVVSRNTFTARGFYRLISPTPARPVVVRSATHLRAGTAPVAPAPER